MCSPISRACYGRRTKQEERNDGRRTVIWECFLMRRDRDLERLWQRAQARDPLGCKFFDGIGEWLEKCRKAPADQAPHGLTCEQPFRDPAQPPLTFFVTHSEDPRINVMLLNWSVLALRGEERHGAAETRYRADGEISQRPRVWRAPPIGRDCALSVQGACKVC